MKKYFALMLMACSLNATPKTNTLGLDLGGIFLPGPLLTWATALSYEKTLHPRFALNTEVVYSCFIVPLGFGSACGGGIDVSAEALILKFNELSFDHGMVFSFGPGVHLINLPDSSKEHNRDSLHLHFPFSLGIHYRIRFANNLVLRTGIKSPIFYPDVPLGRSDPIDGSLIGPKMSLMLAYSF